MSVWAIAKIIIVSLVCYAVYVTELESFQLNSAVCEHKQHIVNLNFTSELTVTPKDSILAAESHCESNPYIAPKHLGRTIVSKDDASRHNHPTIDNSVTVDEPTIGNSMSFETVMRMYHAIEYCKWDDKLNDIEFQPDNVIAPTKTKTKTKAMTSSKLNPHTARTIVDKDDTLAVCANRPVIINSERLSSTVADLDFGLSFKSALQLNRITEYCQWEELQSTRCSECTDSDGNTYDCNCVTTYSYVKGWRSFRTPSVLFNRPAAHWNPQRDPFPSRTTTASTVVADGTIDLAPIVAHKLRSPNRNVVWSPRAAPAPPSALGKLFSLKDTTRYERIRDLETFDRSPAAVGTATGDDRFFYAGNGGWFYSPYQLSAAEAAMRAAGQLLEGSLFDWEIGNFLSVCTAGDIRVRFSVIDPNSVTAVGRLQLPAPGPVTQQLPLLIPLQSDLAKQSVREYAFGGTHEGIKTFEEFVADEITDSNSQLIKVRIGAILLGYFLYYQFGGRNPKQWTMLEYLPGLCIAGMLVTGIQGIICRSPEKFGLLPSTVPDAQPSFVTAALFCTILVLVIIVVTRRRYGRENSKL
jgi:Transmembrane protein 43